MNIHTSGGYFMWSPASYKTVNREALPYPSKGWQEEFWAAARKTVTAIKNYRGTVVTPDRTGSVVDVLYSAAGNSSDEAWYNKNIIAYDFECGVRQFSPTSTSNSGSDPGFTPNFAAEGRAEGQEFADGMYGLMSSALEYQNDTTAPVDGLGAAGHGSQTPISLVFNESEPSDIYYTTDGSTPTTGSTQYQFSGFREQEGETLTFTQTTTLRWFAVDPKGNTSAVSSATYYVVPADVSDLDDGRAGDRQRQGRAGLDAHRRLRLHVTGQASGHRRALRRRAGDVRRDVRVRLRRRDDHGAAPEPGLPGRGGLARLVPERRPKSGLTSQGSITVPDLCGGGQLRLGRGRSRRACSRRRRR